MSSEFVVAGRNRAVLFEAIDQSLSGLITSDKFCVSRSGQLRLDWWRKPLRKRC